MTRIRILCAAFFLLAFATSLFAQDTKFPPQGEQIPGPDQAKTEPANAVTAATRPKNLPRPSRPGLRTSSIGGASA